MARIKVKPLDEDETLFCPFPKHKGKPWDDVLDEDPDYIAWLVSGAGPKMSEGLYDFLIELLEK